MVSNLITTKLLYFTNNADTDLFSHVILNRTSDVYHVGNGFQIINSIYIFIVFIVNSSKGNNFPRV